MHAPLATADALHARLQPLAAQPVIGLDTEFLRERTYYAQLCLLQLSDASDASSLHGWLFGASPLYLVLTPFSALADWLTCRGQAQHAALLAWIVLGYAVARTVSTGRSGKAVRPLREAGLFGALLAAWLAFLAWTGFGPRPVSRPILPEPDLLTVDFHSHTSKSWDGRQSFSPEENMRWHRRAGFDAGFITDHNLVEGAAEAKALSREEYARTGYRSLEGVEVSLHDAHIVALSPEKPIDRTLYDKNLGGLHRFLTDACPRYGAVPILSLPEYWKHHWSRLDLMAGWAAPGGRPACAAGVEIVNSAPKGLDLPPAERKAVVSVARSNGLFLAGATDNHGWARSACVWNAMRVPGHAGLGPDALEDAVLSVLRREGHRAVRVVERTRGPRPQGIWLAVDPPLAAWTLLRTFSLGQALVTLAWIWLLFGATGKFLKTQHQP